MRASPSNLTRRHAPAEIVRPHSLRFTEFLSQLISFSLPLPPLACLGIKDHLAKLQLYSIAPIVICVLVISARELKKALQRRLRHLRARRGRLSSARGHGTVSEEEVDGAEDGSASRPATRASQAAWPTPSLRVADMQSRAKAEPAPAKSSHERNVGYRWATDAQDGGRVHGAPLDRRARLRATFA